jgi:capsular exopolysaccharide synthesis family protein
MRKQIKLGSLQVTSSAVNEGKTLVAANLAVTLAKYSGAKTLLLEGDLHSPTLTSLFGLSELQGLTHWWSTGDQELAPFLYHFNGMPLSFLPAGKALDQPSGILRSARLAAAFSQLANSFDWIVVDSTPMLPIIDVNLWSRLVDGTLLVVREGVAPVKALKKGLESLDHPKLIGVVVNEASQSDQESYEGDYYSAQAHRGKATGKTRMLHRFSDRSRSSEVPLPQ